MGDFTEENGRGKKEEEPSVEQDPFVDSKKVLGLQSSNFGSVIQSKDMVMVMFYEKDDSQSKWARQHFKKAAETTKRPGHAYAAVDCGKDPEFCIDKDVASIPNFQLYSKGLNLPYFSVKPNEFFYEDMKTWIEGHPVSNA